MAYPANSIGQWQSGNLTINAVDLTDYTKRWKISAPKGTFPMPSTSDPYAIFIGLQEGGTLECEFYASYYTALVNETLYAVYNGGTAVTCAGRPTSAAISATNRGFTGSFILPDYTHVDWEMRAAAVTSVTFMQAGIITFPTS